MRYLPHTQEEIASMLEAVGLRNLDELYASIPKQARLDRPLEKELENVISDTRQAIQFVASNFLPEK